VSRGELTSNSVEKDGDVVGDAVIFRSKDKQIEFVPKGITVHVVRGDVVFEYDRTKIDSKYLYYYLQNLEVLNKELFRHITGV